MIKITLILTILIVSVTAVSAQSSGIGLGLSTDGLNGKYWMGGSNALSLNWNFGSAIAVDYLFDKPDVLNVADAPTPVYYGAGLGVSLTDGLNDDLEETTELHVSLRGVAGMSYYLSSMPMDIYLEITPVIGVVGGADFNVNGALGVRYFF